MTRLHPLLRLVSVLVCWLPLAPSARGEPLPTADGFRGIWYANQRTGDQYAYKYSGGMATYPQQQAPLAIYRAEVRKTFFVYGGTTARTGRDRQRLWHMVSYYDHATGEVARPRILLDKRTSDAHDNPVLQIDDRGSLWIFSPSHGTSRPSFIHKSSRPWSIDEFERVSETNFSYAQPWHLPRQGFLFLHTKYGGAKSLGLDAQRCLFWATSGDGQTWSEPRLLAAIELGDYQVSWRSGGRVATAFDYHPRPVGLNARANVYYAQSDDFGRTWTNAAGKRLVTPLVTVDNDALAFDSRAQQQLVYLKDLNFDRQGRPIVLFLTSQGYEPGPASGPRQWQTLHWTGGQWQRRPLTTSDNNYDHGSLYVEPDGAWRVVAPTDEGPQRFNPGGEMAAWTSTDAGATWTKERSLTRGSPLNHSFARRPLDADDDFYTFWADGHGREPSESALYFANRRGEVRRLPRTMDGPTARPEPVPLAERPPGR